MHNEKNMFSIIISSVALIFSGIALYFTFKKDAHRLSLFLKKSPRLYLDCLSINNDSSFPVRLSSIGHINAYGKIIWLDNFCDLTKNKGLGFPIQIDARSTFEGAVIYRQIPEDSEYGYCVQLDCGRTFIAEGNLNKKLSKSLKIKSFLSRITSGKKGFTKNQIHMQKH